MAFQDDFTKLPKDILVARINNDNVVNNAALTSAMLTFGLPTAATGGTATRNTDLSLTAVAGSGYTGSVTVHYNRVDLSTVPGSRSTVFPLGSASKISDLIPTINAAYVINMQPEDYVDGPLPTFTGQPNETHDFSLTANADSFVWINTLTLTVHGNDVPLSSVVTNQTLNGLTYTQPA
jgi:hypothetical protein